MERATEHETDRVEPANDALRPFGVTVERIGGATIIDIPPVPSPRYLRKHLRWIAILFGAGALYIVVGFHMEGGVVAPLPYILSAMIVGAHLLYRCHRHIAFEIAGNSFILLTIERRGRFESFSVPRGDVLEAKVGLNGQLWLRIRNSDAQSIYLTPSNAANEQIAAAIRTALAAEAVPITNYEPGLWYDSRPPRRQAWKTAVFGIALALNATSLVLLGLGYYPLCLLPLLIAAIAAGFALGTQEKEFYL